MSGPIASISADAEQGSIEVGGETYIVVTAVDKVGNAVANALVDVDTGGTNNGVSAPADRGEPVPVSAVNDRDKDADGDRSVDKGDIPACGNDTDPDGDDADRDPTNLQTGADPAVDIGEGTNGDGKCVIYVNARAKDTTRGTHTITPQGG